MSRTQKNKATEGHLGILKSKLAKLRTQLLAPAKTGGSTEGDGFEVSKYGHGRVALIGFPSVGKSTLLTLATGTDSEVGLWLFTPAGCHSIGSAHRTGCHRLSSAVVNRCFFPCALQYRVGLPLPGVTRLVTWTGPYWLSSGEPCFVDCKLTR